MSNGNRNEYTQSGQVLQQQQMSALDVQVNAHRQFLQKRLDRISKWVRQGVRAEALVRFMLLDMSDPKNDKLRECDPQSIYLGLLACAVTGLEPGGLKGEAYLVPFARKAQFIPGWKGLVKQARRSEAVDTIVANVVRENDLFDIDLGTANSVIHKPARKDRGDVIGGYAIACLKGGFREIEWMDREDLDAIQAVATKRGASPAWKDWEDQMQRKSVLRRLAKRLPLGADYFVAMALEQSDDQLPIIDVETDGEGSRGESDAQRADSMRQQAAPQTNGNGNARPAEVNTHTRPPIEAQATEKQSQPAAETKPKAAEKKDRYTSKPAARTEPEQQKTNVEPSPDIKPAPAPAKLPDGYEERNCFDCGVPLEVPKDAPPNQKCEACRNS